MGTPIEFHRSLLPARKAVTMVAHGLNLAPAAMLPLVQWLTGHGSDVFLVKLSGHRQESVPLKEITASLWQQEMMEGYHRARNAANETGVPLHFLGYSLGALLAQSMIALTMEKAPFERQVLLAPAIAIQPRSYLLKFLFIFGRHWSLPSFSPPAYRMNNSLPLHIYDILFTEEKKILQSRQPQLNMPTLVVMDPKDELVSYKKLLQLVERLQLTQYRVISLNPHKGRKFHHLAIDEYTMGEKNWTIICTELERFLYLP